MGKSKNNQREQFTCHHGKGKVDGEKCSVRRNKNMCPNGHPCKRVGK